MEGVFWDIVSMLLGKPACLFFTLYCDELVQYVFFIDTSLNFKKDIYLYLDVVLHEGCYLRECVGRIGNVCGEIGKFMDIKKITTWLNAVIE